MKPFQIVKNEPFVMRLSKAKKVVIKGQLKPSKIVMLLSKHKGGI